MRNLIVITVLAALATSAGRVNAGAVVTKTGEAHLGTITETDAGIQLKMRYGTANYAIADVDWYAVHAGVNSFYKAGLVALRDRRKRMARICFEKSVLTEAVDRERARQRLKDLMRANDPKIDDTIEASAMQHGDMYKGDDPFLGIKDPRDDLPPAPDNSVSKSLKGQLLINTRGGLKRHVDRQLGAKQIYGLYFATRWDLASQRFTPKLVELYEAKKERHIDTFEIIFMSLDRTPLEMKTFIRQMKMPWPAVQFQSVKPHPLSKHMGSAIPYFVLIDGDGNVIADTQTDGKHTGPGRVLRRLESILNKIEADAAAAAAAEEAAEAAAEDE